MANNTVRVGSTVAAWVPSGIIPVVKFDRVDFIYPSGIIKDPAPFSKLYIATGGLYQIIGSVQWLGQEGGTLRGVGIMKNGTTWLAWRAVPPFSGPVSQEYTLDIMTVAQLAIGDYLELGVKQDSGVNQVIAGGTNYTPVFGFALIS